MKLWPFVFAALLCAGSAFGVEIKLPGDIPQAQSLALIQDLRRVAGLPALSPATLNALALSPETAAAAKIAAAQALLEQVSPQFSSEITPETKLFDPPFLAERRRAIGAARSVLAEAGVSRLRDGLSDSAGISPRALENAYTAPAHLEALASEVPGINGDHVRDRIQDGAPRQALDMLQRYIKMRPEAREGEKGRRISRLVRELKIAPESPLVTSFYANLGAARVLLSQRRYGEALAQAQNLQLSVRSWGLRTGTMHALWMDAGEVSDKIRDRGMSALYGARGGMTSSKLAEHVASLGPQAFVGDLLPREPVRIQCYGDCKIQQTYNHPQLSLVAEQMPYPTFLNAVEAKLSNPDARHEGLMEFETGFAVRELGLKIVDAGSVKSADQLAGLLRERGALIATIRFNPAKSFKEARGNHAVIVQGAYFEDGAWKFVMIDSNHSRPQVFGFDELGIFGASGYASMEPMGDDAKELPKALKGITDPAARMRKAVGEFYGKYGAVREVVPWYKSFFWGVVNIARERLGWDPIEPGSREVVDSNLIPLGNKLPAKWQAALNRGLRLPKAAIVTTPDGRRFLNKLVVERLLAQKS